jgi:molybdenum cofactor cytidylyltransferase
MDEAGRDGTGAVPGIGVVILAAGASTRLGVAKQLLAFRGRSLLRHTVAEALAAGCQPIVVVLGAHSERLQEEIADLPVTVMVNAHWSEGMGTSIQAGLAALTTAAGGDAVGAVVLAVCDQPFFSAAILHALIAAHQRSGRAIVATTYEGTCGVPALFSRSLFPHLIALNGHEGARRVIQGRPNETVVVPFPEGAFDIDTAEDYARLAAMSGSALVSPPDLE